MHILNKSEIIDISDFYSDRYSFGRAIEQRIIERIGEAVAWVYDTNTEALLPHELELDNFKARPELYEPLYAIPFITEGE